MQAEYAFVFIGSGDWKVSTGDDWSFEVVELQGDEKVIGHRKIDGSICKVVSTDEGKIVAIPK